MTAVEEGVEVRDARLYPSKTENPYWDRIMEIPPDKLEWKWHGVFSPNGFGDLDTLRGEDMAEWLKTYGRDKLVSTYAWAIPDPATLDFIAALASNGLVEIGAGMGYWAWQLSQLGVDVVAYDYKPPHLIPNHYHSPLRGSWAGPRVDPVVREEIFFDVQHLDAVEAAVKHPERTLFLCWPPYKGRMAVDALNAYRGDRVIYIGEGSGGCTAGAEFHRTLECQWTEIATHRPVQWYGIHDWVTVYERSADPKPVVMSDDDWCLEEPEEDE